MRLKVYRYIGDQRYPNDRYFLLEETDDFVKMLCISPQDDEDDDGNVGGVIVWGLHVQVYDVPKSAFERTYREDHGWFTTDPTSPARSAE